MGHTCSQGAMSPVPPRSWPAAVFGGTYLSTSLRFHSLMLPPPFTPLPSTPWSTPLDPKVLEESGSNHLISQWFLRATFSPQSRQPFPHWTPWLTSQSRRGRQTLEVPRSNPSATSYYLWSWAGCLSSLLLDFLTCTTGMITAYNT